MKQILLYVHYNKNSALHPHVVYQLEKLRAVYARIVFISNSPLSSEAKRAVSPWIDDVFERANSGFDFYAWKEALDREGYERLAHYDAVTLMNDTCFGPLCDIGQANERMMRDACDFWGMINHRRKDEVIPELGTHIPEHVQSFFMSFKADVVKSPAWRAFWEHMECESNVYQVIAKYEVRLTEILREAHFRYKVLIDTIALDLAPDELSYLPADYCLRDSLPLLKIKALLQHKNPKYIIGEIRRLSDYPVHLIEEYISTELQPDRSLPYCNKVLDAHATPVPTSIGSPQPSVAVHVHVYYVEVWKRYVDYLRAMESPYALFVTTDSEEKAGEIAKVFAQQVEHGGVLKEIVVVSNRGRDVLPWFAIADRLAKYDVVLHAHTKKSPTAVGWVGASWQQEIFDTMLEQASSILHAFRNDARLGVAIPDIPRFWRYIAPVRRETDAAFIRLMNELWQRMGCQRVADFQNVPAFVMPYGTMFWYRPAALRKMTSLRIGDHEIPLEPIPDKTVLHAIERLVVYVAWDAGFDFRIVQSRDVESGFTEAVIRNRRDAPPAPAAPPVQHPPPPLAHTVHNQGGRSMIRRGIAKLKSLARPKKIVKMIVPYGVVRLYQTISARRRALLPAVVEVHSTPPQRIHQKIDDCWLRAHRHLQSMNLVRDAEAETRLNLVISSLGRAQLFGGIATCTVFATVLARELNLPLRIITRDGAAMLDQYWAIMAVMGVEPCANVSFYSDSTRGDVGQGCPPLYFSDSDLFLASSWWTATVLRRGVDNRRLYHIIQEDELMFYQRGDDYLDCLNSLNSEGSRYIVNSSYLHAWFEEAYPQIYQNSVVFEPVFPKQVSRNFPEKPTYNLFFYARMTNPRNLFWFGARIIDSCLKSGILDSKEWNIYLAGDDSIPPLEFAGGKQSINLGILSWDEYKEFLQDVDLGVCLIHTPHPGYPVYDVASSGGVAVTNTLYTKSSFPSSDNIVACELSEEAFLEGMKKAVALAKDGATRRRNYLRQQIPYSWNDSFSEVVASVRSQVESQSVGLN